MLMIHSIKSLILTHLVPVLPSYRNCRFVTGFCVRETLALNGLSKFSSLSLIHVDKFCEIQRYINFSKQNE